MIAVTSIAGVKHHIAPAAFLDVHDPADSQAWHGVRAIVRLTDGRVIEATQTVAELMRALQEQSR